MQRRLRSSGAAARPGLTLSSNRSPRYTCAKGDTSSSDTASREKHGIPFKRQAKKTGPISNPAFSKQVSNNGSSKPATEPRKTQSLHEQQPPFPFMKLPAELRAMVYNNLLSTGGAKCTVTRSKPKTRMASQLPCLDHEYELQVAILCASKAINEEASPIWRKNRFIYIESMHHNLPQWLNHMGLPAWRLSHPKTGKT